MSTLTSSERDSICTEIESAIDSNSGSMADAITDEIETLINDILLERERDLSEIKEKAEELYEAIGTVVNKLNGLRNILDD